MVDILHLHALSYRIRRKLGRIMLATRAGRVFLRLNARNQPHYVCPICRYTGPFADVIHGTGRVRRSMCPGCGLYERHRLQHLVLTQLAAETNTALMSVLHIAPETAVSRLLRMRFGVYLTADLRRSDVDCKLDLTRLPIRSGALDMVCASHVLEHIRDDERALREIARVLRPGGMAILPVPLVAPYTIEYPAPNPRDEWHVRAPGPDYFDRYRAVFHRVRVFDSSMFDPRHQLYVYEDRSRWPSRAAPLRPPMAGERHVDAVPVCYV